MPYIGPLNTSEGARKSDFDFDYLSQHPTSGGHSANEVSAVLFNCIVYLLRENNSCNGANILFTNVVVDHGVEIWSNCCGIIG